MLYEFITKVTTPLELTEQHPRLTNIFPSSSIKRRISRQNTIRSRRCFLQVNDANLREIYWYFFFEHRK